MCTCSSALAASVSSASGWSVRASVPRPGPSGPTALGSSCARTSAALASMSSPQRTNVIALRKPPSVLTPDLERSAAAGVPADAGDPDPVRPVAGAA